MLLDFVLPPRCPGCGGEPVHVLCSGCLAELLELALPDGAAEELLPGVIAVGAYAYDGVVRRTIHELKIAGRHGPARSLGTLLRARLGLPRPGPRIAVTWVPSTPAKRRSRGVELPRLLAGPGAISLLRAADARRPDQTALPADARRRLPPGAFVATRPVPAGVVLVDDVRTTGGTARAAARTLRRAGARRVLVATLAVGGDEARALAATG